MLNTDRDALLCDLAETYQIYDMRELPLHTVALLASGLRENSRIKMKMANVQFSNESVLMALIADRLAGIHYAIAGGDKPNSLAAMMVGIETEKESDTDFMLFDSPEDFERARRNILGEI